MVRQPPQLPFRSRARTRISYVPPRAQETDRCVAVVVPQLRHSPPAHRRWTSKYRSPAVRTWSRVSLPIQLT